MFVCFFLHLQFFIVTMCDWQIEIKGILIDWRIDSHRQCHHYLTIDITNAADNQSSLHSAIMSTGKSKQMNLYTALL